MLASGPNEASDVEEEQFPSENSDSVAAGERTKQLTSYKKKALLEFKKKVEEAILGNHLFNPSEEAVTPNKSPLRKTPTPEFGFDYLVWGDASDVSLWGVPLLPSEGHEGTDTILLKFLRAKDFRVSEAFDMLHRTLKWRKEYKIEGILDEEFGSDFKNVTYLDGTDKKGRPLYYNIYGTFKDKHVYHQTLGTEEKWEKFVRWKVQMMEKSIKNMSFKAGGVCSIVQITDLKDTPGPAMKELQIASKRAVTLLQDNYPEFIEKNIFINVPFWYYAYHAVFSRFLSQRTKSKFVFARPSKVAETLLKYVAPENIPIQYGGLKREGDDEFSQQDGGVSEMIIRGAGIGTIEIPVAEQGVTVVWDMTVVAWDVTYKEEFIPDDDCSYKILIKKEKRVEESVRNSFYINEPGKMVLTIENRTYKRKKVYYRSKIKPTPLCNFFR